MTSLKDRYVHAVVRELPEDQRDDLTLELSSTIDDMVDGAVAQGVDPAGAEHAALTTLGHPTLLASSYATGPQYLIGPRFFGVWRRLVRNLLAWVPALVAALAVVAELLEDPVSVGSVVVTGLGAAVTVAIQILFWTTLVFAILERSKDGADALAWDPSKLPDLPAGQRGVSLGEAISTATWNLVVALALALQHSLSWFGADDRVPVLDPDLWPGVLPLMIAACVGAAALEIVKYRTGWTLTVAAGVVLTSLAFTIPLVVVALQERLLSPEFVEAVSMTSEVSVITHNIVAVSAIAICAWEIGEAVVKTYGGRGKSLVRT